MSKRRNQVEELVKRHFSSVLQQEGSYIYGREPLVTVTNVVMSPDLSQAKIYVSVYNTDNKQAVLLLLKEETRSLKQALARRLRSHVRKIPDISIYIDETLDEMFRVDSLFKKLKEKNQLGEEE